MSAFKTSQILNFFENISNFSAIFFSNDFPRTENVFKSKIPVNGII